MKQLFIFIFLSFVLLSCGEKDKTYLSISGQWRCEENSNNNIKFYTIDIEKSSADNNRYAIYNFNNAGVEERIFPTLQNDTLIIESQFIGSSVISTQGFGFVSSDKKSMRLEYSITKDLGTTDILCTCTHQ